MARLHLRLPCDHFQQAADCLSPSVEGSVPTPPYIVLECDGAPANVIFEDGDWNRTLPDLEIFDDVFVDENVYSGLDVDSQHRQNLHELILGDQGVTLNRRLQELVSKITSHNKALDERSKAIPEHVRDGLSVNEFCALQELPDVQTEIETAERTWSPQKTRTV